MWKQFKDMDNYTDFMFTYVTTIEPSSNSQNKLGHVLMFPLTIEQIHEASRLLNQINNVEMSTAYFISLVGIIKHVQIQKSE